MSIENKKRDLLNLLSSNNYDINDDETKQALQLIINENDANDINESLILTRMLSYDEYNKYIKNDSLNGSITENNNNVWHHFINNKEFNIYFAWLNDGGGFNENTWKTTILNNLKTYKKIDFTKYLQDKCYLKDYQYNYDKNTIDITSLYVEQTNNDSTNTYKFNGPMQYILCTNLYWRGYYNGFISQISGNGCSALVSYIDVSSYTINKSNTSETKHIYSTMYSEYWSRQIDFRFQFLSSFRPVFNYVDNRKSNNIYR